MNQTKKMPWWGHTRAMSEKDARSDFSQSHNYYTTKIPLKSISNRIKLVRVLFLATIFGWKHLRILAWETIFTGGPHV